MNPKWIGELPKHINYHSLCFFETRNANVHNSAICKNPKPVTMDKTATLLFKTSGLNRRPLSIKREDGRVTMFKTMPGRRCSLIEPPYKKVADHVHVAEMTRTIEYNKARHFMAIRILPSMKKYFTADNIHQ